MPLSPFAFVAGVVVGWTARATLGSTREALVRTVSMAHALRERARRVVAENIEWVDDMLAEGRARHEAKRDEVQLEDDLPPRVVDVSAAADRPSRGHAA
jgi:hypothetical protein